MNSVLGADRLQQTALLIDADNFSDVRAIEAALAQFKTRAGRVSICRAYGNSTKLLTLAGLWRTLGARTFPNLALEKNTTDAALIADAVALHFQQGVRFFAIASGDADFAPLAVRLREWGCEVWCFSMEGILFQGAEGYYDRVIRFSPQPVATPVVAPVVPAKLPINIAPIRSIDVSLPRRSMPVAKFGPLPKSIKTPSSIPVLPEEVARILSAVPSLCDAPQLLSEVVPVLRQKSIFGKTTKSTAFFARHAIYFKLSPSQQPTQLAYMPPCVASPTPVRKAVAQPGEPFQKALGQPAALKSADVVLSWPGAIRRQATPPLLAELHGLRSVLLQLAVRRVSAADVLLAVPEMLQGQPCALSAVAGRLREKGLLRAYQSALRLLERHPGSFAIQMTAKPPTVVYLR